MRPVQVHIKNTRWSTPEAAEVFTISPQRFAEADARLADADLQIEIAFQPVLLDLQVQHAHAAHQRLASVLVGSPRERGVFLLQ